MQLLRQDIQQGNMYVSHVKVIVYVFFFLKQTDLLKCLNHFRTNLVNVLFGGIADFFDI